MIAPLFPNANQLKTPHGRCVELDDVGNKLGCLGHISTFVIPGEHRNKDSRIIRREGQRACPGLVWLPASSKVAKDPSERQTSGVDWGAPDGHARFA